VKIMDRFCRIIAFFLLVSFVSCTSASYTINGVTITNGAQSPQLRLLQAGGRTSQPAQQQLRQTQTGEQPASPYWTGDGGKGRSITILPPRGFGLTADQAYLPDYVANELVSNFNTFSAMTLFDRVNNQKQYEELLSGLYADDDKAGLDLGHLASTDYMLLGNITRTSTGYALQLTVNRNSDKTTAATYSGTVSIAELDNLVGIRQASLDLLQKMGVQLTAQARAELTRAPETDQLNALTAMAQGIIAERKGTQVAALTYFFQAAAFDASLTEAISRSSIMSTNISTGNIGANVRNDFAWSDAWDTKLKETETFINDMLRNTSPQRSIWYSDNVQEVESARDRTTRTTEFRIDAVLHTHAVVPVSAQRTVQAVYDGLQTTQRAQAWKFDTWPRQGRTNVNPFNRQWGGMIPIAFEILNERGQVIGKQTVEMDSRYSFSGTRLDGPGTAFATVRFTGVKADDITDRMSIRVASINGRKPEEAGISRIEPMPAWQIQANRNFTIYNGTIRPSSNDRNLGSIIIPAEVWGERVTGIADRVYENRGLTGVAIPNSVTIIGANAFANNQLTTVTIPDSVTAIGASVFANNRLTSVIIPEGVTTIGDRAFADNHWATNERASDGSYYTNYPGLTCVTIANSVTYIGNEAFSSYRTIYEDGKSYNYWLVNEVKIGANVNIGKNAIGNDFETFYTRTGKQAGIYRNGVRSMRNDWQRFDDKETMKQVDAKLMTTLHVVLGVLGIGALIALILTKDQRLDSK
jgi:hypothetical protein